MMDTADRTKRLATEKAPETTSGVWPKAANAEKPLPNRVVIDTVVNEVMIRRIMAALLSLE